jgi:REP-associated tyrosine transposase
LNLGILGGAPRIPGFSYVGQYAYFLTICTSDRVTWFTSDDIARPIIEQLLRIADDYGFEVIAYCLMPDHLHALAEGVRTDANLRKFVAIFKQRSSFEHSSRHGARLWQYGYFDRVVREDEDLESICAYIVANPIRADICGTFGDYPYLGCSTYSVEQLREAVQMVPRP